MAATTAPDRTLRHLAWLALGLGCVALAAIAPPMQGLSPAGQVGLGLLALALVLWVTECVSPPVSALVLIAAAVAGLSGLALPGAGQRPLSTSAALGLMLAGFSNTAVWLVAGALFLAAAMQATGLDRRIALSVMRALGVRPAGLVGGAIAVGFILALFVPSATARVGAVIPIMLGVLAALKLPVDSRLGTTLMIVTAQACSVFNIGIKTAAAQNVIGLAFMEQAFGRTVAWGEWFLLALPFTLAMTALVFVLGLLLFRPEAPSGAGAAEMLKGELAALGPVQPAEWRLMAVAAAMLALWATEGALHRIDSASVVMLGIAVLMLPGIGVMDWARANQGFPWGTVVLFAVGIALGTLLSRTGAADWLAQATLGRLGLARLGPVGIVAALSAFNILLHIGFASATGLASTLIPVMIGFARTLDGSGVDPFGVVLIQQFAVSFGFILPVNAPQNMLCYGTGAFSVRQFMLMGLPLTAAGYALLLLLSGTYWRWTGLL